MTEDVAFPVLSREGKGPASSADSGNIVVTHSLRADGFDASEDGTGREIPLVADPISAHEQSTYTHEGNTFRLHNVIPFDTTQVTHPENRSAPQPGAPCHPLAAGAHPPAVAAFTVSAQANGFAWESPVAPTLGAHPQSDTSQRQTGVRTASGVRRLTPRECERLQAFPDDWTRYGRKPDGTRYELADGPRYKCMGNAVTVSVANWLGLRLAAAGGERLGI